MDRIITKFIPIKKYSKR